MADMVPAIIHHFSGNGSIAYGTNIMNSTYHTRYSRSAKPTPSPMKPAHARKISEIHIHGIDAFVGEYASALHAHHNCYLVSSAIAMYKPLPNANNCWQNIANSQAHKCLDWRPCSTPTTSPLPVAETVYRNTYNAFNVDIKKLLSTLLTVPSGRRHVHTMANTIFNTKSTIFTINNDFCLCRCEYVR